MNRPYNATVSNHGDQRPLEELVFLLRGPVLLRTMVVVVAAAGSGIAGYKLFLLHEELAQRMAAGAHLDALRTFVAQAPTPVTVCVGWAATLCFALALLRLRRGPIEPAIGVRSPELRSVADLRRGLRREYLVVRLVVVVLVLVTAVDISRAISFAMGAMHADVSASTQWPMYLEAAGFIVATLVLVSYAREFGTGIARLGALSS